MQGKALRFAAENPDVVAAVRDTHLESA